MPNPPKIALIATGGTIDSLGRDPLDLAFYFETGDRLPDDALLGSVRAQVAPIADVHEIRHPRTPSYAMTDAVWTALADTLAELETAGYDGAVITHGTNTLEETAFFLDLVLASDMPVVLTGAMRPANALSSDGQLNLVNAIRVAASPESRGRGVLVALNDTVHAARFVTKGSTFRVDAFRSPDVGPLGYADADGTVVFYQAPRQRLHVDVPATEQLPRVDIVVSYSAADGALIDAAVAAGAAGIVSVGTGAGRVTKLEAEAYRRAQDAGVVVCQATRVPSGRVARSDAMREQRLVGAGNLPPWKARILLRLLLATTSDIEALQHNFDRC